MYSGLLAVLILLFFLGGLFFIFVFLPASLAAGAFAKLGLTPLQGFLLFLLTLFGRLVDIPVHRSSRLVRFFGVNSVGPFLHVSPFRRPQRPEGILAELQEQTVAVNLGGCVIPVLLSVFLLGRQDGALAHTVWVWADTALVALACAAAVRVEPFFGLRVPLWVPPVATVATAALFAPVNLAPSVAYVAGSLGTLLGGNLLPLLNPRSRDRLDAPLVSVGGSGTFGGVFLAGVLSVLLS